MKPLRSDDPSPRSVQFSHFGVLNDGSNSKGAFFASAIFNGSVLFILILISLAVVNKTADHKDKLAVLIEPIKEQPKPPPPKIIPPKPLPEPPKPIEPPKIQPPRVPLPPEIKPVVVPIPKVNLTPPAPKKVDPPPAPKLVSLANAHAASVVNNDAHPSAVRLGRPDSPISPNMTGPAVSRVNLSNGMPGMPASNTGSGPPSKTVNLGNGSPQGTNINGRSAAIVPVKGLNNGVPGGIGTGNRGPVAVQIAPPQQQVAAVRPTPVASPMAHGPIVVSFPKPAYTAEARAAHIEGDARVSVRFLANGNIQVLGLVSGLGHGLDQAALAAAQGIRFKPATDASNHPIDYTETITIHFVLN
jgi:TonB family protein